MEKEKYKLEQVEMVKMTRNKWEVARWIAIVYLILGVLFTAMWWGGFIVIGAGNQVVDFFFYFFLPVWALITSFIPPL
ncbi:MAG: hypothetical protein ACFFCP_16190 [Promethearchaeota archaeon]